MTTTTNTATVSTVTVGARTAAPRHAVKSLIAATATTFAMLMTVNALATSEPPAPLVQQIQGSTALAHGSTAAVRPA